MGPCLSDNTIAELVSGMLSAEEQARVHGHLDGCEKCRRLVADVAGSSTARVAPPVLVAPGTELGRYRVLSVLGAGAMGVVYAAHDPELGRRIALKLLRPEHGTDADALRTRLLREAQAAAQLSHPNIVGVHDVGTWQGQIFLAMELVDGTTLTRWLADRPRRWPEIVSVFRQAALGLGAAHQAGLVHRDFKPDNVLVGVDGRVRVSDFGLARSSGLPALASGQTVPSPPLLGQDLTRTGALVGTPAFMAPEQLAGRDVDARADIFAFSAALYRAIFGRPPFQADDLEALGKAIGSGARLPRWRDRSAPTWLCRIILRGLDEDPAKRFQSMDELVAALHRGPQVRRRRIVAAVALPVAALVAFGLVRLNRPACTGDDAAWGALWTPEQRASLERAFLATKRTAAPEAFSAFADAIDRWRADWREAHHAACVATRVTGDQSETLLDRRMQCLRDRRSELESTLALFSSVTPELVDRVPSALANLPTLSLCSNLRHLSALVPPPTGAQAQEFEGLSAGLARVRATASLVSAKEGLAEIAPLAKRAEALGYAPLQGQAALLEGRFLAASRDYDAALPQFHRAAQLAQAGHDDALASDAWRQLANVEGFTQDHHAEGHRWCDYAGAALQRLGGDDGAEAARLVTLASIEWHEGPTKWNDAQAHLERARSLFVKTRGPDAWELGGLEEVEGGVLLDAGRMEAALEAFQRGERVWLRAGPNTPGMLYAMLNEAIVLTSLHRFPEAEARYLRALQIEKVNGHSPDFWLRHRYAAMLREKGSFEEALKYDRESLALIDAAHGATPQMRAWPLHGLGDDMLALGRPKDAIPFLEQALPGRKLEGEGDFFYAQARFSLARALWETGLDRKRALALATQAEVGARETASLGGFYKDGHDAIARWLSAHGSVANVTPP